MKESDIKISYTILTHNEDETLEKLLKQLYDNMSVWDEIVIVDDYSDNLETIKIMNKAAERDDVNVFRRQLNKDFAAQKNFANSKCKNPYIFNIDADELFADELIKSLKDIIYINPNIEVFKIPRVNTVSGLTAQHTEMWRWNITNLPQLITEQPVAELSDNDLKLLKVYNLIIEYKDDVIKYFIPVINWHDPQYRLYKNKPEIRWEQPVHERVVGYKTFASFPVKFEYSILHYKDIRKQERQNNFYAEIQTKI